MSLKNLDWDVPFLTLYPTIPRYSVCPSGWYADETLLSNMFVYVSAGSYVLHFDDKTCLVQKSQLAFIPANKHYTAWLTPEQKLHCIDFSFKLFSGEKDFFEIMGCTSDNPIVTLPEKEVMSLFEFMLHPSEQQWNIPQQLALYSGYMRLLMLYMQARLQLEQVNSKFSEILSYFDAHLTEDISLSSLASLHNYNGSYFVEKFKSVVGMPPMKYLALRRVQTAARLLIETEMSVRQIAHKVGISDEYYFQIIFKKHLGLTPTEYRQTLSAPPSR